MCLTTLGLTTRSTTPTGRRPVTGRFASRCTGGLGREVRNETKPRHRSVRCMFRRVGGRWPANIANRRGTVRWPSSDCGLNSPSSFAVASTSTDSSFRPAGPPPGCRFPAKIPAFWKPSDWCLMCWPPQVGSFAGPPRRFEPPRGSFRDTSPRTRRLPRTSTACGQRWGFGRCVRMVEPPTSGPQPTSARPFGGPAAHVSSGPCVACTGHGSPDLDSAARRTVANRRAVSRPVCTFSGDT